MCGRAVARSGSELTPVIAAVWGHARGRSLCSAAVARGGRGRDSRLPACPPSCPASGPAAGPSRARQPAGCHRAPAAPARCCKSPVRAFGAARPSVSDRDGRDEWGAARARASGVPAQRLGTAPSCRAAGSSCPRQSWHCRAPAASSRCPSRPAGRQRPGCLVSARPPSPAPGPPGRCTAGSGSTCCCSADQASNCSSGCLPAPRSGHKNAPRGTAWDTRPSLRHAQACYRPAARRDYRQRIQARASCAKLGRAGEPGRAPAGELRLRRSAA